MSDSVGRIGLDIVLNGADLREQLNRIVNGAIRGTTPGASRTANNTMNNIGSTVSNRLTPAFKKLGGVIAGAFAVKAVVKFGKACTDLGSDLAEVQNVVDVTFQGMSKQVDDFAQNAITQYGISETLAKKYAGTFGAMSKAFKFSEKDAYDMSTALVGLTGDVASFYNMSQDEAYTKLKSIFTGETETLKDLGVVMTQNALDQYALANGYNKTTKEMSEQEKVALRYKFVTEQLSLAQGDFARTSGGWANQIRVLGLQFDSLKAKIGQGLIKALTPAIQALNALLSRLNSVASAFNKFLGITDEKTGSGISTEAMGLTDISSNADDASKSMNALTDSEKEAQKALMGFDEINKLAAPEESEPEGTDETSGGGGMSFGGLGGDLKKEQADVSGLFDKLKKLKDIFNTVKDEFKKGFDIGIGNANLEELKKHLVDIGKSLKDIFTDPDVQDAAKNWALTCVNAFGKVVGAIARIGIVAATTLTGGIDKYLKAHSKDIKDHIITMFNVKADIAAKLGEAAVTIADIFQGVFATEEAEQIVANYINIFAQPFMTIKELVAKFTREIITLIVDPITQNKDKIISVLNSVMKYINTISGEISSTVSFACKKVTEVYDKHIKPLFDSLTKGVSELVGELCDAWNKYISPVLEQLGKRFAEVNEKYAKPAIESITKFIGKLADTLKVLWETALKPLISWIIQNIMPVIAPIFKGIGNIVMNVGAIIWNTLKGVFDALSGLMDFIKGVFTGDWEAAWNGIKDFFVSIWDMIKENLKLVIQTIKDIISTNLDVIGRIVDAALNGIKTFFTNAWESIKNCVSTAVDAIKSKVTDTFDKIKSKVSDIVGKIKAVITTGFELAKISVSNTVGNIKDKVTSVFTAMKDSVKGILDGIKNKFSDVFNSLVEVVKTPLNAIIDLINKAIDGLNSFSVETPDWVKKAASKVGVELGDFSLNIPHVPELANGGYVKANSPQLALIGDNKHEGEIVAPESKLREATSKAVKESIPNMNLANSLKSLFSEIKSAIKMPSISANINMPKITPNVPPLNVASAGNNEPQSNMNIAEIIAESNRNLMQQIVNAISQNKPNVDIDFNPTISIDGKQITKTVVSNVNKTTRATGVSPLISLTEG